MDRRLLLGGVLGAGTLALGTGTAHARPGVPATASDGRAGRLSFVVHAVGLRLATSGRAAPGVGEVALVSARLVSSTGEKQGSLHAEYRSIDHPGRVGPTAPTSIETHHFTLPGGSLVGTGTGSHGAEPDQFSVIGGTGRYAGARGSYTALQHHLGLGGDGSAVYHFHLSDPGD